MAKEEKIQGVVPEQVATPAVVQVEKPKVVLTELQKITGKYIIKRYKEVYLEHMFKKEQDARQLFSRVNDFWQPPLAGSKLILTGLTKAQQEEFEKELNLKPGELAQFNLDYWSKYKLVIKRDTGTVLDCDNNVMDKLTYCLILAESKTGMPRFSMTKQEAEFNPFCEFIVLSAEKEAVQKNKTLELKKKAYKKLDELTLQDQMEFLSVYEQGKYRSSNDNKPDFIQATVGDILEKNPAKFLEVLEDPFYKEYIFLGKCVRENVLSKTGPKYFTKEGELLGNTALEAVINLKDDNYNHIKLDLLSKLESKK